MNFEEMKKLINGEGEKLIFIENDRPTFVLISFEDYKRMNSGQKCLENQKVSPQFKSKLTEKEMKPVSELIAEKQAQMAEKSESPIDFNLEQEFSSIEEPEMPGQELTLEDLPF